MIRFLARLVCGLIACIISAFIVALVLSNRTDVTLTLTPLPYELTLPVYLVIAFAFLLGLMLGTLLYMRLKFRTSLERRRLRRQLAALPAKSKP